MKKKIKKEKVKSKYKKGGRGVNEGMVKFAKTNQGKFDQQGEERDEDVDDEEHDSDDAKRKNKKKME